MSIEYKTLSCKFKALEEAWDALETPENKRPEAICDTHRALTLAADMLCTIHEELNDVPNQGRYRKPESSNSPRTKPTHWKQCAMSLADELGNAVPALFLEASNEGQLLYHAQELAECFTLATTAAASMIAGNLGEDAICSGMEMKKNMAKVDPDLVRVVLEVIK